MTGPWLDEHEPHEPEVAAAQLAAVVARLAPGPARVLDLGCGTGRLLVPLARAGHRVVGVDRDADAVRACGKAAAGTGAECIESTFEAFAPGEPFDAILLLGNTIMTYDRVEDAVALLARCAGWLAPDGVVFIDDVPESFWPEVTEGNWTSGIAEAERLQLVWHATDAVFALRSDDAVDPERWELDASDRCFRMWTDGALALAAGAAGLSTPERATGGNLLVLCKQVRRQGGGPPQGGVRG